MSGFATSGEAILINSGVRAAIVLLIAAVVARALVKASAAVRHRIWALGLCGAVLTPILLLTLPRLEFPVLPRTPTVQEAAHIDSTSTRATGRADTPPPVSWNASRVGAGTEADAPSTTSYLLAVWLLGAILSLLPLIGGLVARRRLLRQSRPFNFRLVAELSARLRLRRSVATFESPESVVPMTWGCIRPTVVLPHAWREWSEDRQRCVLLHELAHVKRLDVVYQLIGRITVVLYWFNPLAWYALRRLRIERELACDDCVIAAGERASTYAGELIQVARFYRPQRLALGIAMTRSARLDQRILAILDRARSRVPISSKVALSLFTAATVVVIVVAAMSFTHRALVAAAAGEEASVAGDDSKSELVRGVVRDVDGNPIAGALILAGQFASDGQRETLTTDANGRFCTTMTREDEPLVIAYKPGMALASRWLSRAYQETGQVQLALRKPAPFVGEVRDTDGQPVPNASVRVELFSIDDASGEAQRNHLIELVVSGSEINSNVTTKTDSRGVFRFAALPEGARAMLKITAENKALLRTMMYFREPAKRYYQGTIDRPAILTLAQEGIIEGFVTTEMPGVDVAGLKVGIQASNNSPVVPAEDWGVLTDSEGRFRFAGLAEGTVNVMLLDHLPDGPWTYHAAQDVLIRAGETSRVEIELIEGRIVEGSVVDLDREPVAGAYVGVYGPIRPRSGAAILGYRTGRNGTYRFHLPPGEAMIYLSGEPKGYRRQKGGATIPVPPDPGVTAGPDFQLRPTIGLRGRLVEKDGTPASGALITRIDRPGQWFDLARRPIAVDKDGRFELARDDPVAFAADEYLKLRVLRSDNTQAEVRVYPRGEDETLIELPAK